MTWKMARNTEKRGKEKCSLWDLDYSKKSEKRGKRELDTLGVGTWREN